MILARSRSCRSRGSPLRAPGSPECRARHTCFWIELLISKEVFKSKDLLSVSALGLLSNINLPRHRRRDERGAVLF